MTLQRYGWNDYFEQQYQQSQLNKLTPGRVAQEIKNHYRLLTADGEISARAAGRMFYHSEGKGDLPTVGDWVLYKIDDGPEALGRIAEVLPRKSIFYRKLPGRAVREQPVAANIDIVFLMTGLDQNFNLRRIERYLTLAWESGANPVILLNKVDICPQAVARQAAAEEVAAGVPVHVISALYGDGLDELDQYLQPGKTVAMLGSSGVGKSTLLNALYGKKIQDVKDIGVAGKGVHTTRTRELFLLPNGAMLIDTPGMREIQLWSVDEGFGEAFPEIEQLAGNCRFDDCTHTHEPGCAVREAVENDRIPKKRYENYVGMRKEMEALEGRKDHKAILERKARDRRFGKMIKRFKKETKKK